MKLVVVNTDLYRYEIHSLVKEFYPEEEVRVVVEGDEHGKKALEETPSVFLRIDYRPEEILLTYSANTCDMETTAGAADASRDGSIAQQWSGETGTSVRLDQKSKGTKDALKAVLYDSLKAVTGKTLPWGDLIGIRPTKIVTGMLEQGKSRAEAVRFMEEKHDVSPEKAELAADIAEREERILAPLHYEDGFSLYIGIPFCPTTCLYCSFPSFNVALWKDRVDDYIDALIREIAATSELMQGKILDTVYIGGGTPTTLEPAQLDRLITAVEAHFDTSHLLEFTVEAGRADSITREKLEVLKRHQVTRISVNPQTMKDETLRVIGRRHTVQQVMDAYHLARDCGFDNINMDIILGLPGENPDDVAATMQGIEALSPDSLTVHSLAIKRASRLRRVIDEKGYPVFVDTDEMMRIAAEGAAKMDMKPYYLYRQKQMSGNLENTGYAREGKYGIYNILIMEEKQSILALGAGSISKIVFRTVNPDGTPNTRIERSDNPKDVATYIANIDDMIARKQALYQGRI